MDKTYLTEEEEVLVADFVRNNKQFEAVRKVLLAGIYDNGTLEADKRAVPTKNFALALFFGHQNESITNEVLGQDLRACAMGITMLESAFSKMISMASPKREPKVDDKNQAR